MSNQRVHSLAKELGIATKELLNVCTKLGIHGKGSALASVDAIEIERIKKHVTEFLVEARLSAELDEFIFDAELDGLLDAESGNPQPPPKKATINEIAHPSAKQLSSPTSSRATPQGSHRKAAPQKASSNDDSDRNRMHLYEAYRKRRVNGWIPIRYATKEGVVLGAWTWRVSNDREHSQIGMFLCEDHYAYKTGSALNWSLRGIFTQAYYQAGTMEIRFVGKSGSEATLESGFEPVIPSQIKALADRLKIKLKHRDRILHDEAAAIYLRITGFGEQLITHFRQKGIDPVWPCVLAQRDIWSELQIEYILSNAASPDRIFSGGACPTLRATYLQDMIVLRNAVMAERLRYFLETLPRDHRNEVDMKWASSHSVSLVTQRQFTFINLENKGRILAEKTPHRILILPRTVAEYRLFSESDRSLASSASIVCVTRDYRSALLTASMNGRPIVALYDTLDDLDQEIVLRLRQTSSSKADLGDRHT